MANGYAALDAAGKVPTTQLPDTVLGAVRYIGVWDAATNSPTIPAASAANKGWYYMVSVTGATNIDGNGEWVVGDWIISNGTRWDRVKNVDAVISVADLRGAITAAALRIALSINNLNNTSDANKPVSTATQTALDLKLDNFGGTMTGNLEMTTGAGIKTSFVVLDPGQPVNPYDAAHKAFVDRNASVGIGQWYQSPSRATGTVYQNTTGRPIIVMLTGSYGSFQQHTGDGIWFETGLLPSVNAGAQFTCVVPPGNYYRLERATNRWMWQELRN